MFKGSNEIVGNINSVSVKCTIKHVYSTSVNLSRNSHADLPLRMWDKVHLLSQKITLGKNSKIRKYTHKQAHGGIHMCTNKPVHPCMHARTHAHTHMHAHTYRM